MSRYRHALPQLSGEFFLTDAGLETDLIFNHGIAIREFAAHTLLCDTKGREAMATYFRAFLSLAHESNAGFILDSQTWKAHMHWATDGRLPTGQSLQEAIDIVDSATDSAAAYFMVNCAHSDHFAHLLADSAPARRIRGLRCNASRRSHDELDQCEALDDGDPLEFGRQYKALAATMPWLNIFGGCCGSDLRHVTQVARALSVWGEYPRPPTHGRHAHSICWH